MMQVQPDTQVSATLQAARQVVERQPSDLLKPMILIVGIFLRGRQFMLNVLVGVISTDLLDQSFFSASSAIRRRSTLSKNGTAPVFASNTRLDSKPIFWLLKGN